MGEVARATSPPVEPAVHRCGSGGMPGNWGKAGSRRSQGCRLFAKIEICGAKADGSSKLATLTEMMPGIPELLPNIGQPQVGQK